MESIPRTVLHALHIAVYNLITPCYEIGWSANLIHCSII